MRTVLLLVVLILLTGCNLSTRASATLSAQSTQAVIVPSLTPIVGVIIATPIPGVLLPTQSGVIVATPTAPAQTVPPASANAIEWLILQIIIPAWNFLYTLVISGVASLWNFAGSRGGLTAQVCGCIVPITLVVVLIARAIFLRRIRIF
jgi:hypothetical protein